jgi:carboxymethylenebutenolidase
MTRSEQVQLSVDDGSEMRAYVAHPDGSGPHPGLIVFMEALGVNDQIRGVADRWAAQGYVAVAPDLFHRTQPGFESDVLDMTVLMPLIRSLTTDGLLADARATHAWLAGRDDVDASRIAAVGFCLGGRAAYLANSALPLAASISYYGGSIAPGLLDRAAALHGRQLCFWGGKDANIPPEQHRAVTDALRAAGKSFVDVEFSDANHGFFNEQVADRYNAAAAHASWAMGLAFVQDALGRASS